MTDHAADAARSSAVILAADLGPNLLPEVEAALAARDDVEPRPGQYDPFAIASFGMGAASLIVSIAQLAWSIYSDRRNHKNGPPSPESVARQVRITLREQDARLPPPTEHIVEVVATEIIRLADGGSE